MSIFTNPASGAKADAQNYIAAILGLVGDADPMSVLGTTPGWCVRTVSGLSRPRLSFRESPGKWSVAEILQHVSDSEIVWGYRLRRVMAEERPQLIGFDQDLWARRLRYDEADSDQALATFKPLREANLRLLKTAPSHDLDRVGIHAERGEESLRHMIRLYAGHDLAHRRQIERVLRAAEAAGQ